MKIEILDRAKSDLLEGFQFYESREAGLGTYFLDSIFSDINSLQLYAGVHQTIHGITAACQNVFRSRSTISSKTD